MSITKRIIDFICSLGIGTRTLRSDAEIVRVTEQPLNRQERRGSKKSKSKKRSKKIRGY